VPRVPGWVAAIGSAQSAPVATSKPAPSAAPAAAPDRVGAFLRARAGGISDGAPTGPLTG